jgi:xanthine dehydrogenase accessory factor
MSELRALAEAAREAWAKGESYFIATVVDVHGSSYRKPGARMVFSAERWLAGSVSGGCLERDVVAKGPYRTRGGQAQLVTYDGATDERSGSGCEGVIDVLVEPGGASHDLTDPINLIARCLRDELVGVSFTAFRSTRSDVRVGARHAELASGESASSWPSSLQEALRGHAAQLLAQHARHGSLPRPEVIHLLGVDLLVELIVPPLHLFVFGGAHDAVPLMNLAKAIGWSVTVCEPHAQLSTRERFRGADRHLVGPLERAIAQLERCVRPAAVIMAHHYERDLAALEALLRSRAPYIGLLGARARAARLRDDVVARGVVLDERGAGRLHAPVGLPIGAESPQEIALSIVAQIQAFSARAEHASARASHEQAPPLALASSA